MLTDREWVDLFDYLLRRLSEINATDTIEEIQIAAAARLIEDVQDAPEFSVSLSDYRDVSTKITRPPSPRESVINAIEVIRIRLEMLPAISDRMSELLHQRPEDIVWRIEGQTRLFNPNITDPSSEDLALTSEQQKEISTAIAHLQALIERV